MKRFLLPIVLLLALVLAACNGISGNGDLVTETFDTRDFTEIHLAGSGTVHVSIGNRTRVEVRTDENVLNALDVKVQDNTLYLGTKNNTWINNYTELTYTIVVPELSGVRVSGSGDMTIDELQTDDFEIGVSGSGEIMLEELVADEIEVDVSGSGDVTITGVADELDANVSGSGNINGYELEITDAEVRISGSGNIEVTASNNIEGNISGSGAVHYRGDADIDVNITGSGRVRADT